VSVKEGGWLAGPIKGRGPEVGGGAAQWEGKGEWAGQGGRRGGPRLGQIHSWDRIRKEFPFKFQLILEFDRNLENCTRRFRRNFGMGIFLKSSRLSKYFRKMKYAMP
jgi:hypothetical protein